MTRIVFSVFSVIMMVLGTGMVSGQNYPNKPIRLVTQEAGGTGDFSSRLIAQGISGPLGQPVIVENRASVTIGEIVAKAPPDGYTLMHAGSGFMFTPLLQKVSYDPVKDFAPVTIVAKVPFILVVHPSLPVKSVKDLIALAKDKPGVLNFAVANAGGGVHIAGELFKAMAGINIVSVSYKGAASAVTGVISGEVQLIFSDAASVAPHAKSGKLRALAVTSTEPSMLYPGLPTVAATGVPGYEMVVLNAVWAPAGTPVTIINRLNQEMVRFLNGADVKEKYLRAGLDAVGSSSEQLAAAVTSEMAKTAKVIKDAGIKLDQ